MKDLISQSAPSQVNPLDMEIARFNTNLKAKNPNLLALIHTIDNILRFLDRNTTRDHTESKHKIRAKSDETNRQQCATYGNRFVQAIQLVGTAGQLAGAGVGIWALLPQNAAYAGLANLTTPIVNAASAVTGLSSIKKETLDGDRTQLQHTADQLRRELDDVSQALSRVTQGREDARSNIQRLLEIFNRTVLAAIGAQ